MACHSIAKKNTIAFGMGVSVTMNELQNLNKYSTLPAHKFNDSLMKLIVVAPLPSFTFIYSALITCPYYPFI